VKWVYVIQYDHGHLSLPLLINQVLEIHLIAFIFWFYWFWPDWLYWTSVCYRFGF